MQFLKAMQSDLTKMNMNANKLFYYCKGTTTEKNESKQ